MTSRLDPTDLRERASRVRFVVFDFDGVFTDNRVLVMEDGTEAVICSRADGFGLDKLRAKGVEMVVLSTEPNPVVGARCAKLGLTCIQGCDDKVAALREAVHERELAMHDVAYLGNDLNDLACLKEVGLPACVADAYPEVKAEAFYVTDAEGGHGAVREFCELIADAIQRRQS